MESTAGWYSNRRQYRSVAFGTWKVGGARLMTSHQNLMTPSNSFVERPEPSAKKRKGHLDRNSGRMGDSSPNLCRLHPTDTQRSLGILPSAFSVDQRLCLTDVQDCYSSSEYVSYHERHGDTGNAASEPIQAAFRADLNSQRGGRLETSLQRAHYRSASAGADAAYSVRSSASTSDMKGPLALTRDNARFLRATKKFFKKIYTSATLPSKAKQQQQQQSLPTETVIRFDPVQDVNIRMMDDEGDEDDRTSRIDDGGESPLDATDSGLDMDRASTPDRSLGTGTMTSKSDTSSHVEHDPPLYNDMFENLRREMMMLRQRDAKILAELHRAEEHILRTARGRPQDYI